MAEENSKIKNRFKMLEEHAFLVLLGVFVVFSAVTVVSYYFSTKSNIDFLKVDLLSVQEVEREKEETLLLTVADEEKEMSINMVGFEGIFRDVPEDYSNALKIEKLYREGIVKGYGDGTFKPNKSISRAEFWTLVNKSIDADLSGGDRDFCFEDVKDEWFAAEVCYAKEKGFVQGFADGFYRPHQPVKKAEATKMLLEAFGVELNLAYQDVFADVKEGDWFTVYALTADEIGLYENGDLFNPNYDMSRGDLVAAIHYLLGY